MFPIKNGLKREDALSTSLSNFALVYAIRKVQINQDGLKLNGKQQLIVYADDVNILGGNLHATSHPPKNTEALVVTNKYIELQGNAD